MATRGCIARATEPGKFKGRYHHWDANPGGLGRKLFQLYRDQFNKDLKKMLAFLLDDHPAGWSSILSADWTKPAGFEGPGPSCYCHGERQEEEQSITEADASGCGVEFAYVFDEKNKQEESRKGHPKPAVAEVVSTE